MMLETLENNGQSDQTISTIGTIMADVADEELIRGGIDTIVGISINGVSFAHEVAENSRLWLPFRTTDNGDGSGSLSNKYGQVNGKKVVIIDDVLSTGKTMTKTIQAIKTHLVEKSA